MSELLTMRLQFTIKSLLVGVTCSAIVATTIAYLWQQHKVVKVGLIAELERVGIGAEWISGVVHAQVVSAQECRDLVNILLTHDEPNSSISITGGVLDREMICQLSRLHSLNALHLLNCSVGADAFVLLPQLRGLLTLSLERMDLDKFNFSVIRNMRVTSLVISACIMEVAGLPGLEANPLIESIAFDKCRVTCKTLEVLASLTNLTDVTFSYTVFADDATDHLGLLVNLRELMLASCRTEDRTARISRQAVLQGHLGLINFGSGYGERLSDPVIRHLGGCTQLASLFIQDAALTDNCVSDIMLLKSLEELYVSDSGLSEVGLRQLSGMKSLRRITVNGLPWAPATGPMNKTQ